MNDENKQVGVARIDRSWIWIAGAAVAVAAVLVVWGLAVGIPPTGGAQGGSTATPSATASGSATPKPSASSSTTAAPDPSEEPEPGARPTEVPIALDGIATATEGIEARLVTIESVEGEATIPGEVGGPALRVTLEVVNSTSTALDTPAVVMNAYLGADMRPAGSLQKPGGKEFPASIPPGQAAQGVYIFTVPVSERGDVTIEVDLGVGTTVVLFQGAVR